MKIKPTLSIIVLLLFSALFSCNSDDNSNTDNNSDTLDNNTEKIDFDLDITKSDNDPDRIGDTYNINIILEDSISVDSAQLFINDKYFSSLTGKNVFFEWDSKDAKTGKNSVTVKIFREGKNYRQTEIITLLSDIIPEQQSYKVINTYKHDKNAYTQGLFIYQGVLFEATGLKGESSIRKIKLETGEILQSYTISNDIFGEGITFFDNKIIQLSWEAHKGFVYDFETFEKVDEFEYYTEGWGLTNDGENLIMSDGTSTLYFIEAQLFTPIGEISVYDNEGPLSYLNELEYINGEIFANVYTKDYIVRIDPETGKVLAYIDLSGILPEKDIDDDTDVLNGIAYDSDNDKIYVTGKKWPKLFEIKITD